MKKSFVLFVTVVFLASLVLAGCGGTEETTTTLAPVTTVTVAPTTTEAPPTTVAAPVAVTWDKAIDYEGQAVAATGPVVAIDDMGEGIAKIQIRIGSAEDSEGLNAMIQYPNKDKFDLESFKGKVVEVTGLVTVNAFELKAEIELTDAAQIKVVGDAAVTPAAAYTADEAKAHYGEEGSVTGKVVAITDLGEQIGKYLIRLDSEEDGAGFNGMVLYANKDKFGDLNALVGKTVTLTGAIYENGFQKKGEIELLDAAQLEIMEAAAYTADEAKAHYGEEGSVTGKVVAITDLGEQIGKYLIRLDSEEDGAGFNGMVLYANKDKFGDLNALVGKTVTLTGAIYENGFQKKGEIELLDAAQLVVK